MDKETLKETVKGILTKMSYTNITFVNGEEDVLIASFDSKELTSFSADLPGWIYSGIQLDLSGGGQFKIEFYKTS